MKKALITITLILSALAIASAVLVLHYFATKKVKVVERPAYVFNIPAIDKYAKYVVNIMLGRLKSLGSLPIYFLMSSAFIRRNGALAS